MESLEDYKGKIEYIDSIAMIGPEWIQVTYNFDPEIPPRVVTNLRTRTITTFRGDGAIIRNYVNGRATKYEPSRGPGGEIFISSEYRWHIPTLAEVTWLETDFSD